MSVAPVRVCVSGGAGAIAYSLVPMIAAGNMFGPNQPVEIHMLDIEASLPKMQGLVMEMDDCEYPLLKGLKATSDANVAFEGINYAVLAGAFPRGPGMERKDLLAKNGAIFREQGKAMGAVADPNAKICVIGNPANTNAYILRHFGNLKPENVSALTRLDQNRARGTIASRVGVHSSDVVNTIIWGNHSATQYPDVNQAKINGKAVRDIVNDNDWLNGPYIKEVQQRGAAIIKARGASSAMSAARAGVDHVRDWFLGNEREYISMAIWSNGNSYGIADELYYSFPVTLSNGTYKIVDGLPIDEFSRKLMKATEAELIEERETAMGGLKA